MLEGVMNPLRKLTQVRPEEMTVASCKGRARVGNLSVIRTSCWIKPVGERDASCL